MHEDNILMERTQNGDKTAYESLVLKHRKKSIEFANSFLLNLSTAEDVVQECFAKVYINRHLYKPTYSFKTYLFTIIRNRCIDELRKEKHRTTVNIDDIYHVSDGSTPEQQLLTKETSQTIFTMLNSLQDNYKTALYLFAVDGMSYKQIAKVMQKTVPQVKILIFRARKKLKLLYEGVDIREG